MPKTIRIALTQGKFALIDAEDWDKVSQYKWCATKGKKTFYAMTSISNGPKHKTLRMHRLIIDAPDGVDVDHRDQNGLNNRKVNLRLDPERQNPQNQGAHKDNTSGYKGVDFDKKSKKWRASIRANGRRIHLGLFNTREEAAVAYNEAAIKYHGEFARLNIYNEEVSASIAICHV